MKSDESFEVRQAVPTEDRYRDIMTACFGQAPEAAYFKWKYEDNPAGRVVAFEALAGDQIAAFYGVIPWLLRIGDRQVRVFQSMDTMTHPNFQRRGLFVKLAHATYAEIGSRFPGSMIIGIPGSTSYPGFVQKLGWTHVLDSRYAFKPRALQARPGRRTARARVLVAMEAPLARCLEGVRGEPNRMSASTNPAFFDWRVFRNPRAPYETILIEEGSEPIGVAVLRRTQPGRVFIEFVESPAADRWPLVLSAVTDHAFASPGVSIVYTWKPTHGARASAFARALFLSNPFRRGPFSYRAPFIVRPDSDVFDGLASRHSGSFDLQPLVQD